MWWKEGVIYQIYPRSFYDSNGDGIGDLKGILQKLDYLNDGTPQSLGIDALWITPIYPSPQKDFGYDVSNYKDIDPSMGTMEDFQTLLEEAHKRGIRIILDWVVNHTSSEHPWFQESRSSRENPYRDWFLWKDPGKGNSVPNNWKSVFGGSAWEWDKTTAQYYLHSFLKEQPDLNWRNPAVQKAVLEGMDFWLKKGVDGFRLDVFNQYFKDSQFRSNPRKWHPLWFFVGLFYGYAKHHHIYDRDQPEMLTALASMRELLNSYPEKMMVGETLAEESFEKAHQYYGHGKGLHLVFNFELLRSSWKASAFKKAILRWEQNVPPEGWPTYVLGNHDVKRHFTRYGRGSHSLPRAKVAAALLLTLRGTPFLYYGEELGMSEVSLSKNEILDPIGKTFYPFYKGRDGCRTPMLWDSSTYSGFSSARPWLPMGEEGSWKNVEQQNENPHSLLHFYRSLIWLRKKSTALKSGTFQFLPSPGKVLSYQRISPQEKFWILLNFSPREISIDPIEKAWELALNSHEVWNRNSLEPYQALVLEQ